MKRLFLVFNLMAVLNLQGCGYTTTSALAPEWKTVHVAPVANAIDFSSQHERPLYLPLLEVKLRNAVSEKFLKDGYLKPAEESVSDVVLKTTLKEFRRDPLRYDPARDVREWRLTLTVGLELVDASGHVVWKEDRFIGDTEQFRAGAKATSEDEAVDAVIHDLAERIVERVVEHW